MQTSGPINSHVAFLSVQPRCSLHTSSRADAAKLEEPIENGAVIPYIKAPLLFLVHLHVIGRHFAEKFDVLIRVKLSHFKAGGRFCSLIQVRMMLWNQGLVSKQKGEGSRPRMRERATWTIYPDTVDGIVHSRKSPFACINHNSLLKRGPFESCVVS